MDNKRRDFVKIGAGTHFGSLIGAGVYFYSKIKCKTDTLWPPEL